MPPGQLKPPALTLAKAVQTSFNEGKNRQKRAAEKAVEEAAAASLGGSGQLCTAQSLVLPQARLDFPRPDPTYRL